MIYFVIIYSILKLYIILDIYQQSHYEIKPYLKYFLSNIFFYNIIAIVYFIITNSNSVLALDIVCGIFLIVLSLLFLIVKVSLKFTKRIIRLIIMSIIYILLISLIKDIGIYIIALIEFTIIPILLIEAIISKLINNKYINLGKSKIKQFKGHIIGITGSYGKTSTKNIFTQALNLYIPTISTPKSFNTPLGISKFINDTNIDVYDNIVLEYGASKPNDIKDLLNIASLDIAVVTEIGYMHMNGFKSLDKVIKEKMSIVKNAKIAILNYDNEYIREYPKDNDVILSYGLFHGDYNARNISTNSFDLYYKDKYIITFDVPFDGRHQILNSLAVIAYLHYLNYDLNILKKGFKLIKLEKNRLEYKRVGNRIILDDSFNSNLIGFKNALNKLSSLNGKRILITPGIVELGKYQVKINKELALYIASSADIVILVGQLEINNLYYNLREYNMELYKTRSFKEAYNLYLKLTKELDQSILLIENDLPDLYKRRLLF